MSVRPPRSRRSRRGRLMRRAGWVVGAPLAVFRFLRRATPVEDIDAAGAPVPVSVETPDPVHQDDRGVEPVTHRLYSATIREPKLTAERVVAIIAADPNVVAPSEVLRFEKNNGEPGDLREGDQLLIRMAGPWNVPVEVTKRWEQGLQLTARRGQPQLGQVELRARAEDGEVVLEIQTRERATGVGFQALQRIGLIRRMQTYTWGEMLENAAQLAGGLRPERITVRSWS